jgi:hypothetical protein
MASDIFEQLAETKVPPVPIDALERGFNDRLNHRITVQQVLDLALRGLPYAALHMTRGMLAVLHYTLFGRFLERKQDGRRGNAREEN